MKLAISNIAWLPEEEETIAELLRSQGIKYVEIAPTKTWSEPTKATEQEIEEYKKWWASYGIEVVAFQSMLFSHPDYKIFESEKSRLITKKYLEDFSVLAGKMGAKRLVFGSPKNRQKGELPENTALAIAEVFFKDIAVVAEQNNTVFCIEPNAPQYNCDFITKAKDGIELVKKVNHPGFGLHLDIACMTLAGDDIATSISDGIEYLKHFHLSAPMLDLVEDREDVNYREALSALKENNYSGFVSIEMRPGATGENIERIKNTISFVKQLLN